MALIFSSEILSTLFRIYNYACLREYENERFGVFAIICVSENKTANITIVTVQYLTLGEWSPSQKTRKMTTRAERKHQLLYPLPLSFAVVPERPFLKHPTLWSHERHLSVPSQHQKRCQSTFRTEIIRGEAIQAPLGGSSVTWSSCSLAATALQWEMFLWVGNKKDNWQS